MEPWFKQAIKEGKVPQVGVQPVTFLAVTQPAAEEHPKRRGKSRFAVQVDTERFSQINTRLASSYARVKTMVEATHTRTSSFFEEVSESSVKYGSAVREERNTLEGTWECYRYSRELRRIYEEHYRLFLALNECYCQFRQARAMIRRIAVCEDNVDGMDVEFDDRFDDDDQGDDRAVDYFASKSGSHEPDDARPHSESGAGSGKKKESRH